MKKILTAAIIITACAALCAAVWASRRRGIVPAEAEIATLNAEIIEPVEPLPVAAEVADNDETVVPSAEIVVLEESEESPEKEETVLPKVPVEPKLAVFKPADNPPVAPSTPPTAADPYLTDVYPNNVYSEELIYDKDGNLIGKTYTIPTEFGPDTIWIDGRAYYDVPGFGLLEWGGLNQRTEDYTMYESGVKVGIMGGEDETPACRTSTTPPPDWPEPTSEIIDQTINTKPERNSTPPDHKPETTPPAE